MDTKFKHWLFEQQRFNPNNDRGLRASSNNVAIRLRQR
jgi:hypothetical protein